MAPTQVPDPPAAPSWLETASLSDVGQVRQRNEDHCAEAPLAGGRHLLVLADGMGGHRGGATASQMACERVRDALLECADDALSSEGEIHLADAIANANRAIFERSRENRALLGMGTTLVAALLSPASEAGGAPEAVIAHVGDSRAYLLREGSLDPLTEDHSVVALLVRRGAITEDEATVHPRRNEILRSIGSDSDVEIDFRRVELRRGDRLLLCSDGLCGVMSSDELRSAALPERRPAEAAKHLVDAANAAGGPDNITVQIADVEN